MAPDTPSLESIAESLCSTARWCYTHRWVPATSGNFSVRVDGRILITASGLDKGTLTPAGRGIFFLNLAGKVVSVEVGPGDLLRVPRGATHWFTLCKDRRIRAVRWLQNTTGWTPDYTESGVDREYHPPCFSPAYFGPRVSTTLHA
jgi:hypothetical protein